MSEKKPEIYDTLSWVKPELDTLLEKAAELTASLTEDPGNRDMLDALKKIIQQVRGTLQIVDLPGGVQLATEIFEVLNALRDETIKDPDSAMTVLSSAVLQLPEYLDFIHSGNADTPLVILPVLNELRATRHEELLSENLVFVPELDVQKDNVTDEIKMGAFRDRIGNFRRRYQASLLPLLRNQIDQKIVGDLIDIFDGLEKISGQQRFKRLWSVAGALAESLMTEIPASNAVKSLFGQLDRVMRSVSDVGEQKAAETLSPEITKNILYYVGRSHSEGDRVQRTRENFNLDDFVPNEQKLLEAKEKFSAPNIRLLETVGKTIREDLEKIRDRVERSARGAPLPQEELDQLPQDLRKVANTLSILGLEDEKRKLDAESLKLKNTLTKATDLNGEDIWMPLAQTMVHTDRALQQYLFSKRTGQGENHTENSRNDVVALGVKESLRDLTQVKEMVSQVYKGAVDRKSLPASIQRLTEVTSALAVMNLSVPLPYLEKLRFHLDLLSQSVELPSESWFSLLAEAFSAVEMYLEAVANFYSHPENLLTAAQTALEKLDLIQVSTVREELDENQEDDALETKIDLDRVDINKTEEELDSEAGKEPLNPVQVPSTTEQKNKNWEGWVLLRANSDEDIFDIFIEEAREESEKIKKNIQEFQRDSSQVESLSEVRRSFHTLKGSGRLAGAELLGEFSWEFENFLNRLLDHSVELKPGYLDLIVESVTAIDQLIDATESQNPEMIVADISALMASAKAASQGECLSSMERKSPEEREEAKNQVTDQSPMVDDGIRALVEELDDFLNATYAGEAVWIDDRIPEILREMAHYLKTTDIRSFQELIQSMADMLASYKAKGIPLSSRLFPMLQQVVVLIDALLLDEAQAQNTIKSGVDRLLEDFNDFRTAQSDANSIMADLTDHTAVTSPLVPHEDDQGLTTEPSSSDSKEETEKWIDTSTNQSQDQELVDIFLEEASDLLQKIDGALQDWLRDGTENTSATGDLRRALHTMKGSARMAGFLVVADLAHAIESRLNLLLETRNYDVPREVTLIQGAIDGMAQILEIIKQGKGGQSYRIDHWLSQLAEPIVKIENPIEDSSVLHEQDQGDFSGHRSKPEDSTLPALNMKADAGIEEHVMSFRSDGIASDFTGSTKSGETVHVQVGLLDSLINQVADVNILQSRIRQEVGRFDFGLNEFKQVINRLRQQLRRLEQETEAQILYSYTQTQNKDEAEMNEFDPLELDRYSSIQQLSRALAETVDDLASIDDILMDETGDLELLLTQERRASTEIQDHLMRTRMIAFSDIESRLQRLVRQTGQETGKPAVLLIEGSEVLIDKSILDRLVPALEHMIRNAFAHGLEFSDERKELNKDPMGELRINIAREGSEIVMSFSDDGRGINKEAVKQRAIQQGLINNTEVISEQQILGLILETGFSTSENINQLSGRGVGMDVVREVVRQLGGTITISSRPGYGTRFILRVPYALAITQALLVQSGEQLFAIPMASIYAISRIAVKDYMSQMESGTVVQSYVDQEYVVYSLEELLNQASGAISGRDLSYYPLIFIQANANRLALKVDSLLGGREIVVKSLGRYFSRLRGVSGATILGDGRIAQILDAADLLRLAAKNRTYSKEISHVASNDHTTRKIVVMVVDDSVTIRRVTQKILERHGYDVVLAKDGVEAQLLLTDKIPDIILTDIEMPRMDGYELLTHIRNQGNLKTIPVMMITSRTAHKHREKALELGADDYLGKPYQEYQLINHIEGLLSRKGQKSFLSHDLSSYGDEGLQ